MIPYTKGHDLFGAVDEAAPMEELSDSRKAALASAQGHGRGVIEIKHSTNLESPFLLRECV